MMDWTVRGAAAVDPTRLHRLHNFRRRAPQSFLGCGCSSH
jgi:hypothetical protein